MTPQGPGPRPRSSLAVLSILMTNGGDSSEQVEHAVQQAKHIGGRSPRRGSILQPVLLNASSKWPANLRRLRDRSDVADLEGTMSYSEH